MKLLRDLTFEVEKLQVMPAIKLCLQEIHLEIPKETVVMNQREKSGSTAWLLVIEYRPAKYRRVPEA